jgi:hypothetical protein
VKLQVRYVGVPAEVKRTIEPIVTRYRASLPGWLARITFEYALEAPEELSGAIAAVVVKHEYRSANIAIYGTRWHAPDVDHERVIVHELSHCHVAPIERLAMSLLERMDESGANDAADPLLGAMYEQHRVAMEQAVEDVALALIEARSARR